MAYRIFNNRIYDKKASELQGFASRMRSQSH
jgi:hypothetical protein